MENDEQAPLASAVGVELDPGSAKRDDVIGFERDARAPAKQRAPLTMPSTLIITNDFPPWVGGIESFVSEICELLDHDVVVYTSGSPDAAVSDRVRPFRSSATDRCCCRRQRSRPERRPCCALPARRG